MVILLVNSFGILWTFSYENISLFNIISISWKWWNVKQVSHRGKTSFSRSDIKSVKMTHLVFVHGVPAYAPGAPCTLQTDMVLANPVRKPKLDLIH